MRAKPAARAARVQRVVMLPAWTTQRRLATSDASVAIRGPWTPTWSRPTRPTAAWNRDTGAKSP